MRCKNCGHSIGRHMIGVCVDCGCTHPEFDNGRSWAELCEQLSRELEARYQQAQWRYARERRERQA